MAKRIDSSRTMSNAGIIVDQIPCSVCQHEIPASEALVAEATDYLIYFCGLDCYERWLNQRNGR